MGTKCVCSGCFDDDLDLSSFIKHSKAPRGCSFCDGDDKPTAPFSEVASFIEQRLTTFYGLALDEDLPYDSSEGGYQSWHVSTQNLLFETLGLCLPRDDQGDLARALVCAIGDHTWCRGRLLSNEFLTLDWEFFCETVKYGRRFFFHKIGGEDVDPYSRSLSEFLVTLGKTIEGFGLIREYPAGYRLYRARKRSPGVRHTTPPELGPPTEYANQSNRMNPPGIPMMYGAESRRLACAEMFSIAPRNAKGLLLSIGRFETQRPVQLLDLANLPSIPGFFSQKPHDDRIGLSFLHAFSEEIKKPVRRDGLAHIDYVPTQVFTEFMRDIKFTTGRVDGILYRSSTGLSGANIVLFATQDDLIEGIRHLYCFSEKKDPWLRLESVKQLEARRADYPNSFLDKS